MRWFRSHIKQGSRLALFALALQFALSFGHFHNAAQAAVQPGATQLDASLALAATDAADQNLQQPASNNDTDQQPADTCAICAVIALASTVLLATPPSLPLPQGSEFLHLTTDAGFIAPNSASAAFQPRAPPAS